MNNSIEDLIREIERRVEDKVLQSSEGELLKKLIRNADNFDEAMNIARMGTVYKRTGLHFTPRIEKPTNMISYFKKNDELSFKDEKSKITHKLIIGENYDALRNLLIQYRNKVDVIYIDPPYAKDSLGEFAKTNYENAITRDNLLSMMYSRLLLAKQLLNDDGVIFCSIDDKNQAYMKCLFDDVFGEAQFVECFSWVRTETPSNLSNKSKKSVEYVICYVKKKNNAKFRALSKVSLSNNGLMNQTNKEHRLVFPANKVITKLPDGVYEKGKYGTRKYDIELLEDTEVKDGFFIKDVELYGKFKWQQDYLKNEIDAGTEISIKTIAFSPSYDKAEYAPEAPWNIINSKFGVGTNENATEELENILGQGSFDNPKPVSLISYLINFVNPTIILDFFAGSGTTAHAVLETNRTDTEEKTFILCQNNEKNETTPNGIAYDVTCKRLKRIMTGECYDGSKDFNWIKNNEPYGGSLDVYEIGYVSDKEHEVGKTAFEVIDETLYGKEKFATMKEKIDWVCHNFQTTQKEVEGDKDWEARERGNAE
jgi:adenine-specific DNA-methyltransferase